jgi:hypothetical protein
MERISLRSSFMAAAGTAAAAPVPAPAENPISLVRLDADAKPDGSLATGFIAATPSVLLLVVSGAGGAGSTFEDVGAAAAAAGAGCFAPRADVDAVRIFL